MSGEEMEETDVEQNGGLVMTERKITEADLSVIKAECAKWQAFLNDVGGVLAFTLALASLGTSCPRLWATASRLQQAWHKNQINHNSASFNVRDS